MLKHLDAILIPVGGYYTIDAAQAKAVVDDLAPRVVIPMHYRSDHFRLSGDRTAGGIYGTLPECGGVRFQCTAPDG